MTQGKMAEDGQSGEELAAESREDFEVVDGAQIPSASELKSDGKERGAADASWSAPIFSLAKKASENLSVSYGNALKSAASVGLIPKPLSNDSPAKQSTAMFIACLLVMVVWGVKRVSGFSHRRGGAG